MPTKMASLIITNCEAGGLLGNLRLSKMIIGITVPVTANTLKKKKSHRGPMFGNVLVNRNINPPQPIADKMINEGRNDRIVGDFCSCI